MVVKRRLGILLSGTVLGASFLIAAPAFAQDAKTEQMQNQINALQQQLQAMQDQVNQTKKDAKAAEQAVQNLPPNIYNAAPAGPSPVVTKGPPSWFDSIHVSMAGSFIALEGAWRQRNEVASGASDLPFGSLPYQNSPLFYENEFAIQRAAEPHRAQGKRRYRPVPAPQSLLRNGLSGRRHDVEFAREQQLYAAYSPGLLRIRQRQLPLPHERRSAVEPGDPGTRSACCRKTKTLR